MESKFSREVAKVSELRQFLSDEFMIALGLPAQGWARKVLGPILDIPTGRVAQVAADFEQLLANSGLGEATRWLLSLFVDSVEVRGDEHIPSEGPVLVASNHPGAYDAVAIMANLPRDDAKLVISDVPATRALPQASQRMIYVSGEAHARMASLRSMIRELRKGAALVIFPTGLVDPDPDVQPGSEQALRDWSSSLEVVLRRVPETRLVVSITSGVLARSCLRHPLTRLVGTPSKKRKLAEFLQISQQLAFSRKFDINVRLSFGEPVTLRDLTAGMAFERLMPAIIEHAQSVLSAHLTPHHEQELAPVRQLAPS
jgi:hypothetical protein